MLYAPLDQHNEEQALTHQTATDSRADSILTVEQTDSLFLVGLTRGSREFDHQVSTIHVFCVLHEGWRPSATVHPAGWAGGL